MIRSSVATPVPPKSFRTAIALTVAAAAFLAGCGQKGGLVLPAAATPAATRSVDQPAPPPAEPAGSASAPVR